MKRANNNKPISFLGFVFHLIIFASASFGGPIAHISLMNKLFVEKYKYVSSHQLNQLYALAQILPGPTSTQTLVGIALLKGGWRWAVITLVIWVIPPALVMYLFALNQYFDYFEAVNLDIFRYVIPIVIAIIATFCLKMLKQLYSNYFLLFLFIGSLIASLVLQEAYVFPMLIILGGVISSYAESGTKGVGNQIKWLKNIQPKQWVYFFILLLLFALLGTIINRSSLFSLPVRLFENFYRNGILVFGGGDILIPLLYNEFVEVKEYLSSDAFLSAFAVQRVLPGPTFSFTSFVGAMSMLAENYSWLGALIGSVLAIVGINLPGFILMNFLTPIWMQTGRGSEKSKVGADGITAVITGFTFYSMILMMQQMEGNILNYLIIVGGVVLFYFTKLNPVWVILLAIVAGYIF